MATTILATMRNEAPFILEWLAYHQAVGFDRFVIFSNDCDDGTDAILAALGRAGVITHIDHQIDPARAIAAQISDRALASGLFAPGDWCLWIDADEFLNIHDGDGHVQALCARIEAAGATGMCLGWRLFGDSGHDRFGGRFVDPAFAMAAAPGGPWDNVKTLFRIGPGLDHFFQHKPMMTPAFWAQGGCFLGPDGRVMAPDGAFMQHWIAGRERGRIDEAYASFDLAQINHYAVRSRALFRAKAARGRIGVAAQAGKARYGARYYRGMNRNDQRDDTILRHRAATDAGIARLRAIIDAAMDYDALIAQHYGDSMTQPDQTTTTTGDATAATPGARVAEADDPRHALYTQMHSTHLDAEAAQRQTSNDRLAGHILSLLAPRRVVDVGCGVGALPQAMVDRGVDAVGVEGAWLDPGTAMLAPARYRIRDLEQPLALDEAPFDLCCCIEVAEHLTPARADGFVADLCALAPVVVFSAAIPGQGGKGHINEQWQSWWAQKFLDRGWRIYDPLRPILRRDPEMMPWLGQNVLVFAHPDAVLGEGVRAAEIPLAACDAIAVTYHKKITRRLRRRLRAARA